MPDDDGPGDEKSSDYKVGYCKPPREHQFVKGKSPNPKGRPKGKPKTTAEIMNQFLNENVCALKQGRRVQVPRILIVLEGLTIKARNGSASAARTLLDYQKYADASLALTQAAHKDYAEAGEEVRRKIEEMAQRIEEQERLEEELNIKHNRSSD